MEGDSSESSEILRDLSLSSRPLILLLPKSSLTLQRQCTQKWARCARTVSLITPPASIGLLRPFIDLIRQPFGLLRPLVGLLRPPFGLKDLLALIGFFKNSTDSTRTRPHRPPQDPLQHQSAPGDPRGHVAAEGGPRAAGGS